MDVCGSAEPTPAPVSMDVCGSGNESADIRSYFNRNCTPTSSGLPLNAEWGPHPHNQQGNEQKSVINDMMIDNNMESARHSTNNDRDELNDEDRVQQQSAKKKYAHANYPPDSIRKLSNGSSAVVSRGDANDRDEDGDQLESANRKPAYVNYPPGTIRELGNGSFKLTLSQFKTVTLS